MKAKKAKGMAKKNGKLSMVAPACHPSAQETEGRL
jgi:hypothetical protein